MGRTDSSGDVRETLMSKWHIANMLRRREEPDDAAEARRLLREALVTAERMRISEADTIREWLQTRRVFQ
jgi:hypothetical protein